MHCVQSAFRQLLLLFRLFSSFQSKLFRCQTTPYARQIAFLYTYIREINYKICAKKKRENEIIKKPLFVHLFLVYIYII